MAMQYILALIGCVSTCFLLWCFNGFTKALRQGKRVVGMFVRVVEEDPKADAAAIKSRNRAAVIPLRRSILGQSGKTAVYAKTSQRAKTLTGLAVLLKLRTGRKTEVYRNSSFETHRHEPATEIIVNSTSKVAL